MKYQTINFNLTADQHEESDINSIDVEATIRHESDSTTVHNHAGDLTNLPCTDTVIESIKVAYSKGYTHYEMWNEMNPVALALRPSLTKLIAREINKRVETLNWEN